MAHSHGKPGGCSRSSRPSRVYYELHDSSNRGGKEIIRWQATEVYSVFIQQYYIYLYIYLSIYLYIYIYVYIYIYFFYECRLGLCKCKTFFERHTKYIYIYIYIYIYTGLYL